jgi:hypothetical protein
MFEHKAERFQRERPVIVTLRDVAARRFHDRGGSVHTVESGFVEPKERIVCLAVYLGLPKPPESRRRFRRWRSAAVRSARPEGAAVRRMTARRATVIGRLG